jgi:hypothetical protein
MLKKAIVVIMHKKNVLFSGSFKDHHKWLSKHEDEFEKGTKLKIYIHGDKPKPYMYTITKNR